MTTIFGGLSPLSHSLDYHLQRQNLIAGNIANVDTPGYAPRELLRTDKAERTEFSLTLKRTDAEHIASVGAEGGGDYRVDEERTEIPGNDLNYVSLDHEMARLSANSLRFKVLGRLVTHHLGILRYAAQNGR
jgi:flagellar basal-body rod protein FlgB